MAGFGLIMAGLIGSSVGAATSHEVGVLDRFCTHQSPELGYESITSEEFGFTDDGQLQVTCTGENGRSGMYVLDVNQTGTGDTR